MNRRSFLQASGLSVIPAVLPASSTLAALPEPRFANDKPVFFTIDSEFLAPDQYLQKLLEVNRTKPIEKDMYGGGGSVAELEKKFATLTGKEKAMYMPTGTMANQLAIHVLSGANTKVFVQETSHVYRDEADAAQSVFSKRLIPVAKGEAAFTIEELQAAIEYHTKGEVFKSGIGVVSIENPVRRNDGKQVPIEEIRRISAWCRQQGYKLHLDGARIFFASVYSGVSIAEYASHFDTIYISLYKYLGAAGGAMLCGDKTTMDQMPHLMKIHGGSMFGSWLNTSMASTMLDGHETRLAAMKKQSEELFMLLEPLGIKVEALPNGTNIHMAKLAQSLQLEKVSGILWKDHQIQIPKFARNNTIPLLINETILRRDNKSLLQSFTAAIKSA